LIAAAQAGGVRIAMLLDAQMPAALDSIKEAVRKAHNPISTPSACAFRARVS
jgi:hypothetical protein